MCSKTYALILHQSYNYSLCKAIKHKTAISMNLKASCFSRKHNLGKRRYIVSFRFLNDKEMLKIAEEWFLYS